MLLSKSAQTYLRNAIKCNFLREEMQSEIKNLTYYHWLKFD